VGGATLSFDVHPGHPYEARVLGLLREVRARVNELWNDVEAYNGKNRDPARRVRRTYFYFGQYVEDSGEDLDRTGDET
jgi:hypothetical protein